MAERMKGLMARINADLASSPLTQEQKEEVLDSLTFYSARQGLEITEEQMKQLIEMEVKRVIADPSTPPETQQALQRFLDQ